VGADESCPESKAVGDRSGVERVKCQIWFIAFDPIFPTQPFVLVVFQPNFDITIACMHSRVLRQNICRLVGFYESHSFYMHAPSKAIPVALERLSES
jgi:hypothetical protein